MMTGYTPHNMLVNFEAPNAKVGDLVNVKIVKAYSWHLLGELVK
jgi:tRNA A37 methylthiotransferase MiaB